MTFSGRSTDDAHAAARPAAPGRMPAWIGPGPPRGRAGRRRTGRTARRRAARRGRLHPRGRRGGDPRPARRPRSRARDGSAVAADETAGAGYASARVAAGRARLRPGAVAAAGARHRGADRVGAAPDRCRRGGAPGGDRPADRPCRHAAARGRGQHVRAAASDVRAGDVCSRPGPRLGARRLAVAAAIGRGRLRVHPTPRVVLLSVGDELRRAGHARRPLATAVFEADGHALEARPGRGHRRGRVGISATTGRSCARRCGPAGPRGPDRHHRRTVGAGARHRQGRAGVDGQRPARPGRDDPGSGTASARWPTIWPATSRSRSSRCRATPSPRRSRSRCSSGRPCGPWPGTPAVPPVVAAEGVEGWVSPPGLRQFVPATVLGVARRGVPRHADR